MSVMNRQRCRERCAYSDLHLPSKQFFQFRFGLVSVAAILRLVGAGSRPKILTKISTLFIERRIRTFFSTTFGFARIMELAQTAHVQFSMAGKALGKS